MKHLLALTLCLLYCSQAIAWQGYNLDTGTVILVSIEGKDDLKMGNVTYFDYDTGEQKLGYLNMYEKNIGLLMDLDTGDLIRVQMEGRESVKQ
jgi:hypothetical protein